MADGGKVIVKIDGDTAGFKSSMNKLGKITGTAVKAAGAGLAAAGAAVAAVSTSAVKAYAEFEQLVGGVDTLFKESSGIIQKYADDAYKTAGLSANRYMDTVTSFSASLLQSLGNDTSKATEYANQAVVDMSDNANKMGTSMELIQNAYQGFAKQNFTMLDNLKLGYGGTKTEMERLLSDAENIKKANGEMVSYSIDSFADMTEAIHVIQTEMGITGTTALEASTTIQGSLGMVKASWENLMVGLSDPDADLGVLIDNFMQSVITFADNLMPAVLRVLENIPVMIETIGTAMIAETPNLVGVLLPPLADAAGQLLTAFTNALTSGAQTISEAALAVVTTLVSTLLNNAPQLIQAALTLIITLAQGIAQALPGLVPAAVEAVVTIVNTLLSNIDMLVDVAINLILALADGLINALPTLIEKTPEIIIKLSDAIVRNAGKLASAALELIVTLGKGLITSIPTLIKNIPQIITAIVKAFTTGLRAIISIGKNIVEGIWNGIINAKNWLLNKIKGFAHTITQGIKDFFGIHSPSTVMRDEVGKMITLGLAEGIEDNRSEVEKVMDDMNKKLLDSEQKYLDESERLKDSKSEADKKYLDELKETSETERKIYDALAEDIKATKKAIVQTYTDIADAAFDSVEEVQKAQESMAKKLSSYGNLYKTTTITSEEGKTQYKRLSDLSEQTKALTQYGDALETIKNRGSVPQEFFSAMRDMSIEEGLDFAQNLMNLSDTEFDKYINNWRTKQEEADRVSKMLYVDEAKAAKEEFENAFKAANDDVEQQGRENAQAWGEGFLAQLAEFVPQIKNSISAAFDSLFAVDGSLSLVGAGGNSYTMTYYVMPSNGESTAEQIKALNDNDTLNKMRGGY